MEGRLTFDKLKEAMDSMVTPQEYLGIDPADLQGEYNYAIDQASLAARTATEIEMQKYAAQRAVDLHKYELEKALKQQMQDALIYGNGAIQQAGGAGYAGVGAGGGAGGAYSAVPINNFFGHDVGKKLTGKEQCPVLIRLLTELFVNSSFSLKYRNLAVLT